MPSSNPTTGLGVAAYVHVSGSSGSSAIGPVGTEMAGQGTGAVASGTKPNAQYALTLSVSAAGGFVTTLAALAGLVDAQNNPYVPTDLDQFTAISYNNPSAGSPGWYRPSAGTSGGSTAYNADVASVVAAGISGSTSSVTITALNPGQAVVEVAFATFDNTLGNTAQPPANQPVQKIFAQILVNVIP